MISDYIFIGTPDFAAIILEKLCQIEYQPILVITEPDKPVGRKQILTPPPVKTIAQKYNLPVLQTDKIENCKLKIENLNPSLIIVAAYGQILPKEILEIPKYGCLNVHPSLLPSYRGPSPIQTAILNGDEFTGVTLILMTEKMDAGAILTSQKLKIKKAPPGSRQRRQQNYLELSDELAYLGADLLFETIPKWLKGEIKPVPQDETRTTYTKIIKKEDGLIDFKKTAQEIERQVRAFYPWPSAYTKIPDKNKGNKILKILEAEVLGTGQNKKIGLFFQKEKEPAVACSKDILILKKVQLEGKKSVAGRDFLNGHRDLIGKILV